MKMWKLVGILIMLAGSAGASDVKLSWNPVSVQAGYTTQKFNVYRAATAGAEVTGATPNCSTPDGATLTCTELNVPPGTWYYKASQVALSSTGASAGRLVESGLSNEQTVIVPAAVIILQVPVQLPPQIITH